MVSTSKDRVLLTSTVFAGSNVNNVDLQGVAYQYNNMSEAFSECHNLKSVNNINDQVLDMTGSFYNCGSLNTITNLPKNLQVMGQRLQKTESIHGNMYRSSSYIYVNTEHGSSNYRYFLVDPNNRYPVYVSDSNSTDYDVCMAYDVAVTSVTNDQLVIEVYGDSYTLTIDTSSSTYQRSYYIDAGTFTSCFNLTSAPAIPRNVTQMYHAFEGSSIIETPDMSNVSGQVFMSSAFSGCSNLVNIPSLPANIRDLDFAFASCSNLVNGPVIPSGVQSLYYTFGYCSKLTTMPTIPNSVQSLGYTFDSCNNLTTVNNLPDSITNMSGTFVRCTNLATVVLPNNVLSLKSAFSGCSNLATAPILPDSTTDMSSTFMDCVNLNSIGIIPNNVTNMVSTFAGCTNLTAAPNIPENVTNTLSCFFGCTNLTGDIYIHSNRIIDADSMFYRSDANQKNVYIPFTYFNGVNTTTYNSFTSAGYDTAGTTNKVYLKDIIKKVNITFNIIQSGTEHDIYVSGNKVISNPMMIPVGTYQLVIYTPEEGIYTGDFTVSEDDITAGKTITVDMTTIRQLTLTLNCTIDGVAVPADVVLKFTDALGNEHVINKNTAVVPEGTIVKYSASYVKNGDEYVANGEANVQATITSEVPLAKIQQENVNLSYPFDNTYNTISTGSLLDNNNFVINDDSKAITSGPSSWHVNNGSSYGYIKFKTPDELTNVSVTCSVSSEANWDYGAVYVGTNLYQPTREQVKNGTTDGSGKYLMTGSGQVDKNTYTAELQPNTTYYLMFIYVKDSSGDSRDDRLTVYDITFTSAPSKKWKVDMNENFTYTIDNEEVLELTKYIGTDGTVKVPEPVWR